MQDRDSTDEAREAHPGQADRFNRALASFTRAELAAPVHAVGGFVDLLVEDAVRSGFEASLADLEKIKGAWVRLAGMVDLFMTHDAAAMAADEDVALVSSKLRHDLRTPIAAILGYAELLGEEATEAGHTAFAETLDALVAAARRLLEQVDSLITVLRARDSEAPVVEAAVAKRHKAFEAIRAVLVKPADPAPVVSGRILIVDDDQTNLDLLSRRLGRDGHEIVTAISGERALAWLDEHPADLILLDLIMPGLTGVDVLRELRGREETRLVPVIIISGLDEAEGAIRCIEAGADDYLSKPVDPVLLRARINAALERKLLRDREIAITKRLEIERERSESLLRNVLPESIVDRLRGGETVIADHFQSATIMFCDIVGFTTLSTRLTPGDTLTLLNTIFSAFDGLALAAGVEKIKTIGDAYMVAGGLPKAGGDHVAAVVAMALLLPGVVEEIGARLKVPLSIRIGIDSGPVVAGIIGTDKFVYDVWGDTVNTASRMEYHGAAGRVHLTEAARDGLGNRYAFEALEPIEIKGKGVMQTYLIA